MDFEPTEEQQQVRTQAKASVVSGRFAPDTVGSGGPTGNGPTGPTLDDWRVPS